MGATVAIDGMEFEKENVKAVEAAFDSKVEKTKTIKKKDTTMKIEKMSLRGAQWYVVRTFTGRYKQQLICAGLALAIGVMFGANI